MTKKIFSMLMAILLMIPFSFGSSASAEGEPEEPGDVPTTNDYWRFIEADEAGIYTKYQAKYEGQWYEMEVEFKDPNTEDEKIEVKQYTLDENQENPVYDNTVTVRVADFAGEAMSIAAACRGENGFEQRSLTHRVLYLDSCFTKKVTEVFNDAAGFSAAVAGVGAIIRNVAPAMGYVSAAAGVMTIEAYKIKWVSDNGRYGIEYHFYGMIPFLVVPLRQ